MGSGQPYSMREDWPQLCSLLSGSLPTLKSCLLDEPEAVGECFTFERFGEGRMA